MGVHSQPHKLTVYLRDLRRTGAIGEYVSVFEHDLKQAMRMSVVESCDDNNDDDDDPDTVVEREHEVARQKGSQEEVKNRGLNNKFTTVMRPFETFVFGRHMKRGQTVGQVMGSVLGKLMKATEDRKKVFVLANSLGAHVLCGLLNRPHQLPYKIHTVFFVQGAIAKDWFHPGAKYGHVHEVVAGPLFRMVNATSFFVTYLVGSMALLSALMVPRLVR
ncbi:hypothetical protein BWQ96_02177 [Gracilariopsis chorda]|uniref:Uncharacterized protein n=1 Tax=Gracilariopsis chorda TaxID=448386 RepID=A0A2V3J0P7_9FLOR|nr:hypothetical protein BWQ96_02177 [Gracilariopsis chorda]|eukprot:PXF47986.1 hypothetical protein BWQ96_02177 [Gracilariopsis chorda]